MIAFFRWILQIKPVDNEANPFSRTGRLSLTSPRLLLTTGSEQVLENKLISSGVLGEASAGSQESVDALVRTSEMDNLPEGRKSLEGKPVKDISLALTTHTRGGGVSNSVVVVVDATKELTLGALEWALNRVVQPGDALTLLGVLHQIPNPMGYKQRADHSIFNGTNAKQIDEEVSKKLEHFKNASMLQDIYSMCDQKGIKLEVKIAPGPYSRQVTVKQATELRATWVILDRHMKKDKKYLVENLKCNLVLMRRNKEGDVIRVCHQPLLMNLAGQSQEEMSLDSSMIVSREVAATISKGFEKNVTNSVRDRQYHSSSENSSPFLTPDYHSSRTYSIDLSKTETSISDVDSESGMVSLNVRPATGMHLMSNRDADLEVNSGGLLLPGSLGGTIEFEPERPDANFGLISNIAWEGLLSTSPSSDLSGRTTEASFMASMTSSPRNSSSLTSSPRTGSNTGMHHHMLGSPVSESPMSTGLHPSTSNMELPVVSVLNHMRSSSFPDIPPTFAYGSSSDFSPSRKSFSTIPVNSPKTPYSQGRSTSHSPFGDPSPGGTPNVYHPAPIPVQPRRNFDRQLLSELLNKQDLISDRQQLQHSQHQEGENQSMETKQPFTPPPEKSRTPLESLGTVFLDAQSRMASPLITLDRDRERDIDRLSMYSLQDDEEANELERTSVMPKRVTSGPPPLCSVCKHKSPEFGRPPRKFSYAELEAATNNFSSENFLAEGGFGFVYKGLLKEGQAVAVKQHKLASTQGDLEFCSEVEVLSCAQHRNLVTLLGYCVERGRRLLVYEFVCNSSLDWHLSSRNPDVLGWASRQKIAVGAARGLRYLHEECRVGCIVHRDMRPNNILLTHDFVPMVGDFGLARWQPSGDTAVETRVIGTLGYVAPEYAEYGQITEKADVFSFGVVLLELITGRKAIDPSRRGQHSLTEWARPLLETRASHELLDPRLESTNYEVYELYCMVHAASLCIRKEPMSRPKMSQVLRILEGDKAGGGSSPPFGSRSYSGDCFGDYGSRQSTSDSVYNFVRSGIESSSIISGKSSEVNILNSQPFVHHNRTRTSTEDRFSSDRSPYAGSRVPHPSLSVRTASSPKVTLGSSPKLSYSEML